VTYWFLLGYAAVALAVFLAALRLHDEIMSDTLAMLDVAAGIISATAALVLVFVFFATNLDRTGCIEHGVRTGMRVEHSWINGCYVRTDGGLVPYDRWIEVTGTNAP
jgi:hypothetical protein